MKKVTYKKLGGFGWLLTVYVVIFVVIFGFAIRESHMVYAAS